MPIDLPNANKDYQKHQKGTTITIKPYFYAPLLHFYVFLIFAFWETCFNTILWIVEWANTFCNYCTGRKIADLGTYLFSATKEDRVGPSLQSRNSLFTSETCCTHCTVELDL